jgi:hypothetical protein
MQLKLWKTFRLHLLDLQFGLWTFKGLQLSDI